MIDWKILCKSILETAGDTLRLILFFVVAAGPVPLALFVSPWFLLIYPIVFFGVEVKETYERKKYEAETEDED